MIKTVRIVLGALLVLGTSIAAAQDDKFFDSKGVSIRYIDEGRGEPIVLVHGIGNSVDTWTMRMILPNLARDYRVMAFDARGHGKSGKPHDPKQYGREQALDIVRLMDFLGIARAHIVGYSMGGNTVSQLLTLRPDRFLSAIQIAGAGRFEWTPELRRNAEQEAAERERDCISRTLTLRLAPLDLPKPTDEELRRLSDACLADAAMDRFAIAALTRARSDQVVSPADVAAVRVPTLGIVGTLDDNARGMHDLKRMRPAMKLVLVEGATHGGDRGILGRPETIAEIRSFLTTHRAGTN